MRQACGAFRRDATEWKPKEEDPLDWTHDNFTDESQQSDREDDDETQFVPPVIDSHETSRLNSTSEPNPDHTSEGTSGDTRKRNAESETETPPPKQPRPTEANVVEEYLKPGLIGKVLLSVGRKRSFDQSNRVKLAETIVLGELGNDAEKSISQKRLSFLSECIVKIFPLETAAIYFTPRVPAKGLVPAVQPKGVLVDKYHNLLRVLRQEGLRTSNRRSRCDEGDEDDFSDSGGDDALDYLEKNSLAKKSVTIAKWHETVHKRYSMLLNTVDRKSKARMGQEKIDVYYNQFPCLKQQWGLDLLMDDFDELFANRCLNVLENWTSIVAKLEKVLQKVYTPDACCTEAGENVRLLQAIPSLFRQPPVPYGKKLAKGELRVHWKPNRQESVNGFLLHAENNSILTDRVQQIKDKCGKVSQNASAVCCSCRTHTR
ncbi:uncharacterized protein LOC117653262 [Thrips palmi]|uniref:Uncharacterized protein LOC117653262 n=1 Tax=Thrips palmi TaxID=161013 RepID=A0A6P9AB67_THRPL|nr:uncharacterized protein LOC117653262 [Thrips palmi]